MADTEWNTDFEAALARAEKTGKELLIDFSAAPL
jgi:hypothetical protein